MTTHADSSADAPDQAPKRVKPHQLALVLFTAMRERLAVADVPLPFRGAAIGMITAGLIALAFMGFAGLV